MKKLFISFFFAIQVINASAQSDPNQKITPIGKTQVVRLDSSILNSQLRNMEDLVKKLEASLNELDKQIDQMKNTRESLSDQSQQQQIKMQMIMDRMTKADSAASNSMKKFSEVCSQIIQNMK